MTTLEIMKTAKSVCASLASVTTDEKNTALLYMAEELENNTDRILAANRTDVDAARGRITDVMIDRLTLTEQRIKDMAKGIREVTELPDPIGRTLASVTRPNGLVIEKRSVPMGVIAIIYESRPNVTSDASALALKAGSACILRGGKEAYNSSAAIVEAMQAGLVRAGLPGELIQLVSDTTRESSYELMRGVGYIDLLIPRGGAGLIRACVENALVPCIQTGTGICHIYVDETADIGKALNIIENAKTSRPSVCNAAEVCVVNEKIAPEFLPLFKKRLTDDRSEKGLVPVELRLDPRAAAIIDGTPAGEKDFDTEFLDYIMAVKTVADVDEAIYHIQLHSTHHSDCIITETKENADKFIQLVDSAAVYWNASTRFTDGGEFGLGCEMGISTQKLHARGPLGLEELTTYKYVILGSGQIR
ncbi:MAG: glutamate-5-semialdehyde dehydrogenase [Oscillospiraceae bacterium]|nr:glutamate-5-semialdehyde dehydrogenase [Oscillospiraceae bacterium]